MKEFGWEPRAGVRKELNDKAWRARGGSLCSRAGQQVLVALRAGLRGGSGIGTDWWTHTLQRQQSGRLMWGASCSH